MGGTTRVRKKSIRLKEKVGGDDADNEEEEEDERFCSFTYLTVFRYMSSAFSSSHCLAFRYLAKSVSFSCAFSKANKKGSRQFVLPAENVRASLDCLLAKAVFDGKK